LPVPAKTASDIGPMILPNPFEAWLSPAARAPSLTPNTSTGQGARLQNPPCMKRLVAQRRITKAGTPPMNEA